jgi:hypothetical protein
VQHHIYDGAMHSAADERAHAAEPTDRRPDFCAEAMTPAMRVGILLGSIFAAMLVVLVVGSQAIWPEGLFSVSPFLAVFSIGMLIAVGFFVLLVFGAMLGNNPRIKPDERAIWYAAFVLLGPFALPIYWLMHVRPIPYQPTPFQKT